jgi:hypothetical protein
MAAVNACFVPDDGEAATNGGSRLQQPVSSVPTAETVQQGEGSLSGNNVFDTTTDISCSETSVTFALNYLLCLKILVSFTKITLRNGIAQ